MTVRVKIEVKEREGEAQRKPETSAGQSQGSPFEQTEGNLPGQQVRATTRASEAKK